MITKHIWDTSGSIFWMESTCSAKSAMWSHCWVYSKCDQSVIGLHIVVTLGWLFKMGVICNQWAHFCYSGSKHSECAQFLTIGQIVDPSQRTFKMYLIFNCWVHCGQMLSVPTMYSPCTHWVYGSLSPVWRTNGQWQWQWHATIKTNDPTEPPPRNLRAVTPDDKKVDWGEDEP